MKYYTVLKDIGPFSESDLLCFEEAAVRRHVNKNELLLKEGMVCRSVFYVLSGLLYQYRSGEIQEEIIDLHLEKEWVFNHASLIGQSPSTTAIKCFAKSEILELSLERLHALIAASKAFLQFGKIFNQHQARTYLFDNGLSPARKYRYIQEAKPGIAAVFPVKMIASYLKMAPETLSRVRAMP
ncbi:Crp/Fnr family transcriptional regulator [Niabella beijingensis]|uniref:Crp/Fnr family transcriptional regulator n=1 Tax=Niabella beijingensis TaxID=2872700 RepID=UPI001CBD5C8E|nr:Crp/Fnr family transcriptional regulator [Niabella beijingensis]MBZ4188123.1 Crp/Fnr family transcriptional regulator [Niabella beijingensis]